MSTPAHGIVLDHVFIATGVNAPEADVLGAAGIEEGLGDTQQGQGTACRRFPLSLQYLDCYWVKREPEARSDRSRPAQFWDRWLRRGDVCPFGLAFRPARDETAVAPAAPFPTWPYSPEYLPSTWAIDIAQDMPLTGPAMFYLPFRRDPKGSERLHLDGCWQTAITHVRIGVPGGAPTSDAFRWARAAGLLSFTPAERYTLTLVFDGGVIGGSVDLRPRLPLTLEW